MYVVQDESTPNFAVHSKAVQIGKSEGRAMDKLDIPPVDDAGGAKVVGTGVYTGAASVKWSIGRFGFEVTDKNGDVGSLLADVQAAWTSK